MKLFHNLRGLALVATFSIASQMTDGATIDVIVGGPGILKYNPQFVNANPGDVVRFTFKQKNHTATQSTFESPCVRAPDGFDSGLYVAIHFLCPALAIELNDTNFSVPVADTQTNAFPVAQLQVVDNAPIWVYCRQGNHCQQGMVFAVNPDDKFAAFQAAATGSSPPSTTAASPTAPEIVTVTATVTVSGQALTTTYDSYPGSAAPTTGLSVDHRIIVGGPGKLTYDPSNVTAQVGDTVTFEFHQKNHTVTASSFSAPCRALSLTSGELGFDSGFMPVSASATEFPSYTIDINDTNPIWAYCRQGNHCGQGMVFSINAIESGPNNFAAFKAKAIELNGTATTPANSDAIKATIALSTTPRALLLGLVLIAQGGPQGSGEDEAKRVQEEQMRRDLISTVLDTAARERLSRIALVSPERSKQIEGILVRMAQSGQLRGRVTENQLIELLEQVRDTCDFWMFIHVLIDSLERWKKLRYQRRKDLDDDFDI
ncbi:Programmed cell death protein 5 [Hypsizygus marmoreus]|uniref:Programmed cell death protein 5 n=1 Tax=Hypsizygus marmoreus TaxID=39966 RepID=A0A369JLH3_HYPMA|nr:Programmed cell death protein 5 [Hypsizygus marmoreus]